MRIGNIDNKSVALLGSQGIQYATGPLGNRPQEFIAQGLQLFLCVLVEALQFGRVPFDVLLQIGFGGFTQRALLRLELFLRVFQFLLALFSVCLLALQRGIEFL